MHQALTKFDLICVGWGVLSFLGLVVIMYDLFGDTDPFLIMISLQISLQ